MQHTVLSKEKQSAIYVGRQGERILGGGDHVMVRKMYASCVNLGSASGDDKMVKSNRSARADY